MLETLFGKHDAIVALDDVPDVASANRVSMAADALEIAKRNEETHLWRVLCGKERASEEERDEAERRLAGPRHSDSGRYLEERISAERDAKRARKAYEETRSAAKDRLSAEALVQLRPLVERVVDELNRASMMAEELRIATDEYGQAGYDIPQYPFPALLNGGLVAWQISLARQIFGLDRPKE